MKMSYYDRIATFLTNLPAVTTGLLLLVGFMIFETQTLFEKILPTADMDKWKVQIASYLVAITFEFTVLIFTANSDKLRNGSKIPLLLAVASFILNCWFWGAFKFTNLIIISQSRSDVILRYFVSALIAYLNYIYSHLFVHIWEVRASEKNLIADLKRIESLNRELRDRNQEKHSNLQAVERELYLKKAELKSIKKRLQELACPYCGDIQQNERALRAHIPRCPKVQIES